MRSLLGIFLILMSIATFYFGGVYFLGLPPISAVEDLVPVLKMAILTIVVSALLIGGIYMLSPME